MAYNVRPSDYSNAGNANRFSVWYHGLLAYADALGWLWWSGHKWESNEHRAVDKAIALTEDMLLDAMTDLQTAMHQEADAREI